MSVEKKWFGMLAKERLVLNGVLDILELECLRYWVI